MPLPWDNVNDSSGAGAVNGQVGGDGAVAMPLPKPPLPPTTWFDSLPGEHITGGGPTPSGSADPSSCDLDDNANPDPANGNGNDYDPADAERQQVVDEMVDTLQVKRRMNSRPADLKFPLMRALERLRALDKAPAKPVSLAERWPGYQAELAKLRGRKLIGLESGMAGLDEMTLGLRGLTILHSPAGHGKTTLQLQVGLGVLAHQNDAALIFLSLDMPANELIHRLVCNLARMEWHVYARGSTEILKSPPGEVDGWHTEADRKRIEEANDILHGFGKCLFMVDRTSLPAQYDAGVLKELVRKAKEQAGVSRALVCVDYLQLLPTPAIAYKRMPPEHDQVRLVQDAMTPGDAWWVVSEARKPGKGQDQEYGLAAIMGSARIGYACDFAASYRPMTSEEEYAHDWTPARPSNWNGKFGPLQLDEAKVAPMMLQFDKARDGGTRGELALAFQYTRSRFVEVQKLDEATLQGQQQEVKEIQLVKQLERIMKYITSKPCMPGVTSKEIESLGAGINKNTASKLLNELLDRLLIVRTHRLPADAPNTRRWTWLDQKWLMVPNTPFTDEVKSNLRGGKEIQDLLPDWKG